MVSQPGAFPVQEFAAATGAQWGAHGPAILSLSRGDIVSFASCSLARWAHTAPGVPQGHRGCREPIPAPHCSYDQAAANTGSSRGHGKGAMQIVTETQTVLGWKGCERSSHSNPPSRAETPKLHPWPGSWHPMSIKHSKCRFQSAAFGDPSAARAVTETHTEFPH